GHSVVMWHPYQLRGLEFVQVGEGTVFETDLQLTVTNTPSSEIAPSITIGDHCLIRRGTHITAANQITIGNHLLTGTNVLITDNSHGATDYASLVVPPNERAVVSHGPVKIGNHVWLGNNVCILPNVTIGDGAVVGANSVVTHDIPPYAIVAGIPAKIVKQVTP
ncbi:MAG: acyltransferase, partial [Prevotella sp.]|nr:acyltransferase [Prevotella sp.]